jgi:hypothetical protein
MLPHALSGDPFPRRSLTGVESDECAGFVPALWAGGPEPFDVASIASGVGHAAEAVHGRTSADVVVLAVDGVALPSEGEPVKCAWGEHDRYL